MSERFRLLFRGEILEGQHQAVVKKRLAKLLGIDEAKAERLFAGKPVVIKKDADRATAERYQAEFKRAGARLRVANGNSAVSSASPAPASSADPTLAEPGAMMSDGAGEPPPPAPDTSHLSVAETGSDMLQDEHREAEVVLDLDSDWDLAEPGADLGQITSEAVAVEIDPDFTLAPAGADLDEREKSAPPAPPDTSHINLEDADDAEH